VEREGGGCGLAGFDRAGQEVESEDFHCSSCGKIRSPIIMMCCWSWYSRGERRELDVSEVGDGNFFDVEVGDKIRLD
jgi:hypothetical protein